MVLLVPGRMTACGLPSSRGDLNVAQRDAGLGTQRIEIVEVGDVRQADHRDVDAPSRPGSDERVQGDGVLFRDGQRGQVRDHAKHRHAAALFQDADAVGEQRRIAAELVDHQAADQGSFLRFQQPERAEQLGEDAAAVDVAGQQHRGAGVASDGHVHDVERTQVQLRRTARSLDHHQLVSGPQPIESAP